MTLAVAKDTDSQIYQDGHLKTVLPEPLPHCHQNEKPNSFNRNYHKHETSRRVHYFSK